MNDGRRQPRSILVCNQNWKPGVHHADERVGRPKIDADDFVHVAQSRRYDARINLDRPFATAVWAISNRPSLSCREAR
jgi:hypothetical protein